MSIRRGTTSLYTPKSSFGCSFERCEWLTLSHLDEENRAYWNNDGIDVTDCRHVRISDCRVNAADDGICLKSDCADLRGPEVDFFHNPFPCSICGIPGNEIEDVLIENVDISYPGRATKGMAYMPLWRLDDVPEEVGKYPEFSMFGELPAWGFYVRHVNRITFHCVHLSLRDSDFRPAFVFDDVRQLTMEQVTPDESVFN